MTPEYFWAELLKQFGPNGYPWWITFADRFSQDELKALFNAVAAVLEADEPLEGSHSGAWG